MPRLIIRTGDSPLSHELAEEVTTLGRGPENLIQLGDPSVSGRHAEVRRDGEIWRVKDLQSTNGTRVNGETINEVALRVGDRLRFGKVEASFEADPNSGSQALPEPSVIAAKPAQSSARPPDFENASPFPARKTTRDPVQTAIVAAALAALLAFLASMIAVMTMHGPS